MKHVGISIIVPNYNGAKLLEQYLPFAVAACEAYDGPSEIIVSDDASSDESESVVARFPDCRFVRRPENGGFSANCNFGAQHSEYPVLCFLNSDARIGPEFLVHAGAHFADEDCFAVTPMGRTVGNDQIADQAVFMCWRRGKVSHSTMLSAERLEAAGFQAPHHCSRVQGAYFFVERAKFESLGGFDAVYSPYYWEETDISYRAQKLGWHIVYEPRCEAWHEHSTTISNHSNAVRRVGRRKRNQIVFHLINMHNWRLLTPFMLYTLLNLLTLKPSRLFAFASCLKRLPYILRSRRRAKREAIRSDAEVLGWGEERIQRCSK
jgi:GT2 family glycosyltransferase